MKPQYFDTTPTGHQDPHTDPRAIPLARHDKNEGSTFVSRWWAEFTLLLRPKVKVTKNINSPRYP